MLQDTITYVQGADWFYDIAASTLSTPINNQVIMRFKSPRDFRIPLNLAGSVIEAEVPPSSAVTITLYSIPAGAGAGSRTSLGTFDIGTDGLATNISVPAVTISSGTMLELEVGTANAIDEVFFTMKTVAP